MSDPRTGNERLASEARANSIERRVERAGASASSGGGAYGRGAAAGRQGRGTLFVPKLELARARRRLPRLEPDSPHAHAPRERAIEKRSRRLHEPPALSLARNERALRSTLTSI